MTLYFHSPRRLARRYEALADGQRPEVHIPVDVTADDEGYTLTALVPGIEPEEVKIEVLEDAIAIRGDFSHAGPEGNQTLLRERPSGHFSRTLRLPTAVDANKAEAEVKHGVLTVRVPKAEAAKARQIKVRAK
ncbi:MAG: Hsp20/alpha crystallin family protein [Chloroflexi bacterium]|nr:Hsp20/alpha crystallin family protein [Chloroflexota bacterium]